MEGMCTVSVTLSVTYLHVLK